MIREPVELHPFSFRLEGHGHDIPAGTFEAEDEQKAFKLAFQKCKGFELPGWVLRCVESGTRQNVVQFVDHSETSPRGTPMKKRA